MHAQHDYNLANFSQQSDVLSLIPDKVHRRGFPFPLPFFEEVRMDSRVRRVQVPGHTAV